MTKDEALKRALEALELLCVKCRSNEWGPDTPRKEILNWMHNHASKAHTAIKEALAQPEQKPVAWEQFHQYLVERNFCPRCGKRLASGFVEISIHTCTPPKKKIPVKEVYKREWVGLTDEEIDALRLATGYAAGLERFTVIAQVIEAKLKEKNT